MWVNGLENYGCFMLNRWKWQSINVDIHLQPIYERDNDEVTP